MAWILHEPRMVAEVPVFCVCAIHPLLESRRSPITVSLGAIKLLYHLHLRLDVLVKSDTVIFDDLDRDTPVLWESCWLPILKAISLGSKDSRLEVKNSALHYLAMTLSDPHADAVPTGLLINLISDTFLPSILSGLHVHADPASTMGDGLISANNEVISNCFDVLSSLLSKNADKIIVYPTFDKLWIRIVSVFSDLMDNDVVKLQSELNDTLSKRCSSLFDNFKRLGIFEEKVELLKLTEHIHSGKVAKT